MNIVEKESKTFSKMFYDGPLNNTLENFKSQLLTKLYDFSRDKDKLDFLKVLRQEAVQIKDSHLQKCKSPNCRLEEEHELGIYAIDQEIDCINRYYTFEPKSDDTFNSEEEADIHSKLNEVIEKLKDLGLGQQIIFEEIESLKDHFNLGKKTWYQLLKGKIFDLTIQGLIDKTVVATIFNIVGDGCNELLKIVK